MQAVRRSGWRWLLVLGACVPLGCSGGDVERAPVYPASGTVTLDGKPLAGAVVTFVPEEKGKSAATGTTDESGKFQLTTWAKDDGAEVGHYRVTVTKYEGSANDAEPAAAPAENNSSDSLVLEEEYPADYDETKESEAPPSKNVLAPKFAQAETSGLEADVTEAPEENVFEFKLAK